MPSIYQLKPKFQALLRPLTKGLAKAGITANHVTVFAMLLSIATGFAIYQWGTTFRWPLFAVPVILFVRMALNAIDGMLAREHHQASKLGAILNELGDVVSDTALYLPFAVLPLVHAPLVVGVVVLAIISEMTGVIGIQIGASRRYDGPMGKSDRAFLFGALALALACGFKETQWISVVLAVVCGLLCLTILNRVRNALKETTLP